MAKYPLPVISDIRARKNTKELKCISKAQTITEAVVAEALAILKPNITEAEVAQFIVSRFKTKGVKALAFEPIVAFGKNTAEIHHDPDKRKLKEGDLIMLDLGATVEGYCSDMTRTYFYGKPNKKQIQVYLGVLEAQERVLKAIYEGERSAKKLDTIARTFLERKFGKTAFPHGLGHGVGMVIHEWPNLHLKTKDILQDGMVITVEPGVYIKGWGGVRIEDMILITRDGYRNLTTLPKYLDAMLITPKTEAKSVSKKPARQKRAR